MPYQLDLHAVHTIAGILAASIRVRADRQLGAALLEIHELGRDGAVASCLFGPEAALRLPYALAACAALAREATP